MKRESLKFVAILLVAAMMISCSSNTAPASSVPPPPGSSSTEASKSGAEASSTTVKNEDYKKDFGFYPLVGDIEVGPEATQSSKEKIALTVWMTPQWTLSDEVLSGGKSATCEEFLLEALNRFAASYSGAEITSVSIENFPGSNRDEKLSVAASSGTLPDMIFESFFAISSRAHEGLLAPITDTVINSDRTDIPQAIWDAVTVGDNVYCYPYSQGMNFLAYNADMFRAAGLDKYIAGEYDLAHWTPEDFEVIAKALREKANVDPLAITCKSSNGDTWNLKYMRMFGGQWFDDSGRIVANNPDTVKGLQYIVDLKNNKLTNSNPETLDSPGVLLMNKEAAVAVMNSANLNRYRDEMQSGKIESFDIRAAYMPGTEKIISTYVMGLSVFNTGKEAEMTAAKDFIRWINSNETLKQESRWVIPVNTTIFEKHLDLNPMFNVYAQAAPYAIDFSNNSPSYTEIRNLLYPELQAAFTGLKTPQQALDDYTASANKVLEEGIKKSVALGG